MKRYIIDTIIPFFVIGTCLFVAVYSFIETDHMVCEMAKIQIARTF